jgi:hypothetical protein
MNKLAFILILLIAPAAFAQQRQVSFGEIDDRARSIDAAPPAELAYALTSNYTTEREKLRSIFTWITDHISYRVKKNYAGRSLNVQHLNFKDSLQWKSGNDFMAETVLQNRSAVCDGYTRLFKTLCDYAGLRSAVITGFAKGDYSRQLKFRCNHTWNAVYIDSAWHLLDITWASGYTNYSGDEFTKRLDETYFLPAPQDFIRDHFPDDLRWTLMENPPFPHEFSGGPYRNKCFSKYKISSYQPAGGIIEAAVGDTIQISLVSADPKQDSKMTPDTTTSFDEGLQKIISPVAFLEPLAAAENKPAVQYTFIVQDAGIEWLHIIYHHDTVLRYRLKIKKEQTRASTNPIASTGASSTFSP